MNSHFWMRKLELVGKRKPHCDARAVIEAAQWEAEVAKRKAAARAAARRLWQAMDRWAA